MLPFRGIGSFCMLLRTRAAFSETPDRHGLLLSELMMMSAGFQVK